MSTIIILNQSDKKIVMVIIALRFLKFFFKKLLNFSNTEVKGEP